VSETAGDISFIILLLGISLIGIIAIKGALGQTVIPSLIGFIALGFVIRLVDEQWSILDHEAEYIFTFLSKLGVIALLFRIGLESHPGRLLEQLKRASLIWISGLLISGLSGYVVAFHILGLELIPSLFTGVAMTATSVGVPVAVWQEAGALRSRNGSLLIDVAEFDDISGVLLMVLLFAIAPLLRKGFDQSVTVLLLQEMGMIILKFILFAAMCFLFALYVEQHITNFMGKWVSSSNVLLVSLGFGFIIAAIAGMAGFSVAIGAFFAGLAFSRDPDKVKMDASFDTLYEMFSPFFFIGIGISIAPGSLTAAAGMGLLLFFVAGLGKLIGHGLPAWLTGGLTGFLLIGVSMIPRAEITMIIMEHGLKLGPWAVPQQVFTAMVFVVLTTCMAATLTIRILLEKWPQRENNNT
jgi:Kef-type K+ transport system membrane component KefB